MFVRPIRRPARIRSRTRSHPYTRKRASPRRPVSRYVSTAFGIPGGRARHGFASAESQNNLPRFRSGRDSIERSRKRFLVPRNDRTPVWNGSRTQRPFEPCDRRDRPWNGTTTCDGRPRQTFHTNSSVFPIPGVLLPFSRVRGGGKKANTVRGTGRRRE